MQYIQQFNSLWRKHICDCKKSNWNRFLCKVRRKKVRTHTPTVVHTWSNNNHNGLSILTWRPAFMSFTILFSGFVSVSMSFLLAFFLSFSRSAGWFFCCFYLFGDQSVNTSWRVHFVCCLRALSLIIKLTPISFCVLLCNNIGFARDTAKFMGNLISFVVCSFVCLLKISLFVFIGVCSECHFPSWSALKLMSWFRLYILFFYQQNVTSKIVGRWEGNRWK